MYDHLAKYKSQIEIQIPKPKMLCFGCTTKCIAIFLQKNFTRNPMGMSIWPNTNMIYQKLTCSILVVQQSVLPFFHSKFYQKSNWHVHLAKYKSQIQIQIQIPKPKILLLLLLAARRAGSTDTFVCLSVLSVCLYGILQ